MAYALIRFKKVTLPDRVVTDDLSTGRVDSTLQNSIGSVFDYFGARTRLPRVHEWTHSGKYVGETTYIVDQVDNFIIDETGRFLTAGNDIQMLQSALDALKREIGQRGELWRRRDADGVLHWKLARLLEVQNLQSEERVGHVAELACSFESAMGGGWRAETPTLATATANAGVASALTAYVGGDFSVNDAVLRVARTSGTITAVSIAGQGISLSWAGSLIAGQTLEIDSGAQTARVDGVDAYGGVTLGSGHTAGSLIALAPGANVLTVIVTGGAADVSIEYFSQFP